MEQNTAHLLYVPLVRIKESMFLLLEMLYSIVVAY